MINFDTYFENPGYPTEEERGVYCPHGVKIAEFDRDFDWRQIIDPWPCNRWWCTRDRFESSYLDMLRDSEADSG